MHTIVNRKFPVKPVVAALALALSAVNAHAVPTPNQMPGYGLILGLNGATIITSPGGQYQVGTGVVGQQVYNFDVTKAGPALQLEAAGAAYGVIRWGNFGGSLETVNPAGFNLGSGATMVITSKAGVTSAALLNIDTSGNQSQIYGSLIGDNSGGGAAPSIFVANGNGIIVGASGKISSPSGIGLIGARMLVNDTDTTSTAVYDFVGASASTFSNVDVFANNGSVPAYKTAPVDVRGSINGDKLANLPAAYVLLAGSDVVNTGNVFGTDVHVYAGMVPQSGQTDTVNGVALTPVQRLFNASLGLPIAVLGTSSVPCSICVEIDQQNSGSTFKNLTGSVSSKKGSINIDAALGIQTGVNGDPIQFIGLFADSNIHTDVFRVSGSTGLYNVIAGYSTGFLLTSLNVNTKSGSDGDVTLNALTRASEPSSITTSGGGVTIYGDHVYIDSTINHTLTKYNLGYDLIINGGNLVEINAPVGAGNNVYITSVGPGGIKIAATVDSNQDTGFGDENGQVTIKSTASGAPITITAGVHDHGNDGFTQDARVVGNGPISISGTLTSAFGDVYVTNLSNFATDLLTTVTGDSDVFIDVQGPLNITSIVQATNDNIIINSTGGGYNTTLTGTLTANNGSVEANFNGPVEFTNSPADSYVYGNKHVYINNTNGYGTSLTGLIESSQYDVRVNVNGQLFIEGIIRGGDDVKVTNTSLASGTTTTIIGYLDAKGDDVEVKNQGSAFTTHLDITGGLTANDNVLVTSTGDLVLASVDAGHNVDVTVGGLNSVLLDTVTAGNKLTYTGNFATTKVHQSAVLSAPTVELDVLNFAGTQDDGMPYASVLDKSTQIYTNNLKVKALGSINSVVAGSTNWPENAMWVAPYSFGMLLLPPPVVTTVNASISAVGAGFQAINLGFMGDLMVDSGNTRAPFDSIGLTTGGFPAGSPAGNAGSSMILQATGALTILGNGSTFFPLISPPDSFIFPGGLVFIAGTVLNQTVPVLTAYTDSAPSWKGVFYEAGTAINLFSYSQVNGNSWLNVSMLPTTGVPTAYSLKLLGPASFGNVLSPEAVHLNAYTTVVTGGPVEFCPGIPPSCI